MLGRLQSNTNFRMLVECDSCHPADSPGGVFPAFPCETAGLRARYGPAGVHQWADLADRSMRRRAAPGRGQLVCTSGPGAYGGGSGQSGRAFGQPGARAVRIVGTVARALTASPRRPLAGADFGVADRTKQSSPRIAGLAVSFPFVVNVERRIPTFCGVATGGRCFFRREKRPAPRGPGDVRDVAVFFGGRRGRQKRRAF